MARGKQARIEIAPRLQLVTVTSCDESVRAKRDAEGKQTRIEIAPCFAIDDGHQLNCKTGANAIPDLAWDCLGMDLI